jgi:hypothetical protein
MSATKKAPAIVAPKQQNQTWKKNDHPAYYSNIMQIALTPFDVSIVFGMVSEVSAEEITCVPNAKVTISPEQAANLMRMLGASLQGYVKQFGNLRPSGVGSPAPAPSGEKG